MRGVFFCVSLQSNAVENFIRPPEAPVYRPTEEEFKDPMEYIKKIQPEAERSGICKVIPPPGWLPPFCLDPKAFKFTPRVQSLALVDAFTRVKAQWLSKLETFWKYRGPRCLPVIKDHQVRLVFSHQVVDRECSDSWIVMSV
jgi:histone demethylase JARID1